MSKCDSYVLNSRLMLEYEAGRRQAGYDAAKQAAQSFPHSAVIWRNFAESCWSSFRSGEAIDALKRSASRRLVDYHGSPCHDLAFLLADKGRIAEAWAALAQAQEHRARREPFTWVIDQQRFDGAVAYVLFHAGLDAHACAWARRAYERPHRSNTSDEPRDLEFIDAFLFWIMVRQHITGLRERELSGDNDVRARRLALEVESWALTRQVRKLLADETYLISVLRASIVPARRTRTRCSCRISPRCCRAAWRTIRCDAPELPKNFPRASRTSTPSRPSWIGARVSASRLSPSASEPGMGLIRSIKYRSGPGWR